MDVDALPPSPYPRPVPTLKPSDFGLKLSTTISRFLYLEWRIGMVWGVVVASAWFVIYSLIEWVTVGLTAGHWSMDDVLRASPEFMIHHTMFAATIVKMVLAGLTSIVGLLLMAAAMRRLSAPAGNFTAADVWRRSGSLMVASALKAFVVIAGFLLLLFPGIYLLARLLFVYPLMLEKGLGAGDAFAESWRMTAPIAWQLSLYLLCAALAMPLGAAIILYLASQTPLAAYHTSFGLWALYFLAGTDYLLLKAHAYTKYRTLEEGTVAFVSYRRPPTPNHMV